jgi:hypothetical protein
LGNNKAWKVTGIGSIKLKLVDRGIKILHHVRHVPDLKRKLISLGILDKQGYVYKVKVGVLRITKGSMV